MFRSGRIRGNIVFPWRPSVHGMAESPMVVASDLRAGMILQLEGQMPRVKEGKLIRIEVATGKYLERVKEAKR